MSIPKPRKDSVEPVTASPSSPSKLFTPVVASLDQVRNHKITLLFKAIEQGDIPLVLTFIYLSTRDMCGIFYETCHFNIILLFMDHFILLGDVSHEMEQHWPREWSFLPRGCGWPGAVSPLVSVPKVFIPTAGQIKKKTHIFHNSHLHIAYYM